MINKLLLEWNSLSSCKERLKCVNPPNPITEALQEFGQHRHVWGRLPGKLSQTEGLLTAEHWGKRWNQDQGTGEE